MAGADTFVQSSVTKEGEQFLQLSLIGAAAIFANFESFGVTDRVGFVGAIKITEFRAKTFGLIFVTMFEMAANLPVPLPGLGWIARNQSGRTIGASFIELRFQGVQRVQLLFNHGINRDRDVRL